LRCGRGAQLVSSEQVTALVVVGKVGVPMKLHIHTSIGWHDCPNAGGACVLTASDVPNPEYQFFGGGNLPPGLAFDSATGILSGTPLTSGRWNRSFGRSDGTRS